jgi:hypothetical protein
MGISEFALMTSVRESLRRLIQGVQEPVENRSKFAYKINWTSVVRGWDPERQGKMNVILKEVVDGIDLEANQLERCYHIPELDAEVHSGLSLRVLMEVLEAFE